MELCQLCNSANIYIDEHMGCVVCCDCGLEQQMLNLKPEYHDKERVSLSKRYKYTKLDHFKITINNFMGYTPFARRKKGINENKCRLPPNIIEDCKKSLQYYINNNDIEMDDVYHRLNMNKCTKYYQYVPYIFYTITDKTPPDLIPYIPDLIKAHTKFEEVFEKLIKDGVIKRKNALNVQFKLYICLKMIGHELPLSMFHTCKTESKIMDHIYICNLVLNKL